MNITEVFHLLGLGNEYSKIYDVLLKGGKMRVIGIATKTRLPRTSCYEYIPKLIELNLIEEVVEGKSRLFSAKSPGNLLNILYKLKNDVNFTLGTFEAEYSELLSLYERNEKGTIKIIEDIVELNEIVSSLCIENNIAFGPSAFEEISDTKLKSNLKKLKKTTKYNEKIFKKIVKVVSNDKILYINLISGLSILINDYDFASFEQNLV